MKRSDNGDGDGRRDPNSQPRTIIVTDGEQRSALATVRSLGAAGHRVHVGASRRRSLAGASKYAASEFTLPDPLHAPDDFIRALASASDSLASDVVIPVTEASLLAVLTQRERIRGVMPFPSDSAFRDVCDKARVLAAAERHGIAVPSQIVLESLAGVDAVASDIRFPLVIKPFRSVVGSGSDRAKTSVLYASNLDEMRRALSSLPAAAFPVMLQERVEGPGFAISVLLWDGELRAAFGHRRLREKPPSGGVSVLREAMAYDESLLTRSVALLGEFDWRGVAMVEYKLQQRTGVPYLMEINGRLWGSLQLAIDAGVDFPKLLVRSVLEEQVTPVLAYDETTRTRWEWGDVDHLLAVLRHSRERLSLPPSAPTRLETLASFVATTVGRSHSEVFWARDPLPFVRESVDWFLRR
ncbi:MAG TPA: ATP-grasp domain-containing protein [Gemmatimonadaceae bacterium]|jgi:predicted ATP-grasp superfamily ATP-dependent carboligase